MAQRYCCNYLFRALPLSSLTLFKAVNNFLNNVLFSATPSEDAVPILAIAQDEPNQLGILTGFLSPDDSNGMQASQNLQDFFPAVPSSLQDIINAGDDPNAVAAAVAALNTNRSVSEYVVLSREESTWLNADWIQMFQRVGEHWYSLGERNCWQWAFWHWLPAGTKWLPVS